MKKIIIIMILLLSVTAYAQTIPLDQKQWYVKSKEGAAPPQWNGDEYVNNTGLQNAAGHMCIAQSDANCCQCFVPGAGAIFETRIRDGNGAALADTTLLSAVTAALPDTNIGLIVLSTLWGWDGTNFIPANITTTGFLRFDQYSIGGNAVNVNGGAMDTGTQTVTLATDDPAVTSLAIIDDWDATEDSPASSDGAQIMIEARSTQKTAMTASGDATRPVGNLYGETVNAGFVWATNSNRTGEVDPLSEHYSNYQLCALTAITSSTTAYCGYIDMSSYQTLTIQCVATTTPTDTTTYTVECSADPEAVPASATYGDVTLAFLDMITNTHNANYVDAQSVLTIETKAFHWCRVKYVTNAGGGNDGAIACYVNKLY